MREENLNTPPKEVNSTEGLGEDGLTELSVPFYHLEEYALVDFYELDNFNPADNLPSSAPTNVVQNEPIPANPRAVLQSLFKVGEVYGLEPNVAEIESFPAMIDFIEAKVSSAYSVIHAFYSALVRDDFARPPSLNHEYSEKIPDGTSAEVAATLTCLHKLVSGESGTYGGVEGVKRDLQSSKDFILSVINEVSFRQFSALQDPYRMLWGEEWETFGKTSCPSETEVNRVFDIHALRLMQTRREVSRIREVLTQNVDAQILLEQSFLFPELISIVQQFKSRKSGVEVAVTSAHRLGQNQDTFTSEVSGTPESMRKAARDLLEDLANLEINVLMPAQIELEKQRVSLFPFASSESLFDELCRAIVLVSYLSDSFINCNKPLPEVSQQVFEKVDSKLKELIEKSRAKDGVPSQIPGRLVDWVGDDSSQPIESAFSNKNGGVLRPVRGRMVEWLYEPSGPSAVEYLIHQALLDPDLLKQYSLVYGRGLVKARTSTPDNSSSFPKSWMESLGGGRCGGTDVSYHYRSYSWGTGIYMDILPIYD